MSQADQDLENPFVGLKPFGPEDALRFFGRHEQSMELLARLHEKHFTAVIGTSGCGKSSLVKAGAIPMLKGGMLVADNVRWIVAEMKPGDTPLRNLAVGLADAFRNEIPELDVDELATSIWESGIEEIRRTFGPTLEIERANLLIIVDQFEEIFRVEESQEVGEAYQTEASRLVSLIQQIAAPPIYVVMTMRSEYIGKCEAFHGLPETINESIYLVPRLGRRQREQAIKGPIRLMGAEIDPALVNRILDEAGNRFDELPILQHSLFRLWDEWRAHPDGPIDMDDYKAIGGVSGVIEKDAMKAYRESLQSDSDRQLLRKVFQGLTDKDQNNQLVRRRRKLSLIAEEAGVDDQDVLRVLAPFMTEVDQRRFGYAKGIDRQFVICIPNDCRDGCSIDISHESLIRQWTELADWVEKEAGHREMMIEIARDARRWKFEDGSLRRGLELREARDWWNEVSPTRAWTRRYRIDETTFELVNEFLQKSTLEERLERERRQKQARFRRNIARAAAVVALGIGVLGGWNIWQQGTIASQQENLDIQADSLYQAKKLAEAAAVQAAEKTELAERAQAAATDATKRRDAATDSLNDVKLSLVLEQSRTRSLNKKLVDSVEALGVTRRGLLASERSRRVADSLAQAARRRTVAAALPATALRQVQAGNDTLAAQLARQAFYFSKKDSIEFADPIYQAMVKSLNALSDDPGYRGGPEVIDFQSRIRTLAEWGGMIVVGTERGVFEVNLADQTTRGLTRMPETVRALDLSADGSSWVSGSDEGDVVLWTKRSDGSYGQTQLGSCQGGVWAVDISDDGSLIAAAGADDSVRVWRVSGDLRHAAFATDASVRTVRFSPDQRFVGYGTELGVVGLWEWEREERPERHWKTDQGRLRALAFSPRTDEIVFATAGDPNRALIWRFQEHEGGFDQAIRNHYLIGHEGSVYSVSFSSNGELLATSSGDGTVQIWDMNNIGFIPITLRGHRSWVTSSVFTADGLHLVTGSADGTVRIWNTDLQDLCRRVSELTAGVQTPPNVWTDNVGSDFDYQEDYLDQSCQQ